MRPALLDYCAWWLACLDETALSGAGVLMASPLDVGADVVDIIKKNGRCVARSKRVRDAMRPDSSAIFTEDTAICIPQWAGGCCTETPRGLELFEIERMEHQSLRASSSMCLHVVSGVSGSHNCMYIAADMHVLNAVHMGYIRNRLKELGMPDDVSGEVPPGMRAALMAYVKEPSESPMTWEVVLRSLCNIHIPAAMSKLHDVLGECQKPFTLAMPKRTYYSKAGILRSLAVVARREDLLSGKSDVGKHTEGFDLAVFLKNNPALEECSGLPWWRVDRMKVMQ